MGKAADNWNLYPYLPPFIRIFLCFSGTDPSQTEILIF